MEVIGMIAMAVLAFSLALTCLIQSWKVDLLKSNTIELRGNLQSHVDVILQQEKELIQLRHDVSFYRMCLDKATEAIARHSEGPIMVAGADLKDNRPVHVGSDGKVYPSCPPPSVDDITKQLQEVSYTAPYIAAGPSAWNFKADDKPACPEENCLHSARARENFGIGTMLDSDQERRYREYLDS